MKDFLHSDEKMMKDWLDNPMGLWPPGVLELLARERLYADTPEEEDDIRSRMAAIHCNRRQEQIEVYRKVVQALGLHEACPRRACRRAKACTTRLVNCYWENREFVNRLVMPSVKALLAGRTDAPESA